MTALHKIVIVGGGAGGLELVTQLGNAFAKSKTVQITLIDQNLTHIWKPLLHEIAAGTLNAHEEEINYFAHSAAHGYEFILGKMLHVDRTAKQIEISSSHQSKYAAIQHRFIDYDTLIIAIGSHSNDFNTPGVRENCHFLDSREQADHFHQDLLNLYLDAQHQTDTRALNIAIIGAGATGVELAAELYEAKNIFYQYGLNKIDPELVNIHLIEASPRILSALSEQISHQTEQQLKNFGIHVHCAHRVEKVDEHYIYFANGNRIAADLSVWAAGIKAPEVLTTIEGLDYDNLNRLHVYATLQTTQDPAIFAFGDCAHCQPIADEPVLAPRAQVASQQASFLVEALKSRIKGQSLPMFKFSDKGSLVSLSQHKAIGELIGAVHVQGMLAKTMYVSLYRLHQANVHGYTHAGVITLKDMLARKFGPKIKLH
jgi:NADH:ubiquinone reductase (H+-translocating)